MVCEGAHIRKLERTGKEAIVAYFKVLEGLNASQNGKCKQIKGIRQGTGFYFWNPLRNAC
jgi:hypothetical protein